MSLTIRGAGYPVVNKTDPRLCFHGAYNPAGETGNQGGHCGCMSLGQLSMGCISANCKDVMVTSGMLCLDHMYLTLLEDMGVWHQY